MFKLDGLGRKILQVIDSQDNFTLLSRDVIGGDLPSQMASVQKALRTVACESLIFADGGFDKYTLLDAMNSKTRLQHSASDQQKGSYYRAICDSLGKLKRVCVVVYDADGLAGEDLRLLARISSFAKRSQLLFSAIFIGDIELTSKACYLGGIEIDRYIPRRAAANQFVPSAKDRFGLPETGFSQNSYSDRHF